MSEEEIKDMLLKQYLELTTNNDLRPPISAYNGVDIDDVVRTCKQLQDKKTYLDLVKENRKLNLELSGYRQAILNNKEMLGLNEENQELKKQLENCYCERTDCSGRIKDSKQYDSLVQKVETQQKEFIEYLENEININPYDISDYDYEDIINTILSKYKNIIGVSNENN